MKNCLLLLSAVLFSAANLVATTIQFQITDLGMNGSGQTVDRYTYIASGLTLQSSSTAATELDIEFDPAVFGVLSNPIIGSGLQSLVFQPNEFGSLLPGDLLLISQSGDTPVSTPFSIDFTLLGSALPGSQPFAVKQLDANGNVTSVLESGTTSPLSQVVAPEPATFPLGGLTLLIGVFLLAARRKFVRVV